MRVHVCVCPCIDVLSIDYVRLSCIIVAGRANFGFACSQCNCSSSSESCNMLRQWQPSSANWQLQKPHREFSDESVANRALRRATFCGKQNALECGKVSDRLQIGIAIKSDRPQRQCAPMWQAVASSSSRRQQVACGNWHVVRVSASVCVWKLCVLPARCVAFQLKITLAWLPPILPRTRGRGRATCTCMHACCSIPYKMATRCDNKQ